MTLIRRQVIEAEGGFAHLSHILGDDHELGAMTVRQGLRVLQGPVVDELYARGARWLAGGALER